MSTGFTHTAFSLLHESPLSTDQLPDDTVVPPAHLLRILQKGLLYMSAEAMYRGEDTSRPPRLIGYAVNETLPLPPVPEALGEEERKLVAEVRARGEGKTVEVQTDEIVPPTPPPAPVDRKGKGKAREDTDVEMEDADSLAKKNNVEVGVQTEENLLEQIRMATESAPKVNGDASEGEKEKVERPAKPSRTGTSERLEKPADGDKPTSKGEKEKSTTGQKRPPGKDPTPSSSKLAVPSNSNKPLATKRKASNDAITDDSAGKRAKTRDGDSLPSPADKDPSQPTMSANSTVKIIRSTIRAPDASGSANKRRSMSPTATRNPGGEKRFVIPGQKNASATPGPSANRGRSNSLSQTAKPPTPAPSGPSKSTTGPNASLQPKGTPAKEKSKSRSPAPPSTASKPTPAANATTGALANGKVDGGAGRAMKSVGQGSELQLRGHQASVSRNPALQSSLSRSDESAFLDRANPSSGTRSNPTTSPPAPATIRCAFGTFPPTGLQGSSCLRASFASIRAR